MNYFYYVRVFLFCYNLLLYNLCSLIFFLCIFNIYIYIYIYIGYKKADEKKLEKNRRKKW